MRDRIVFLVSSSKGEISCKKIETEELRDMNKNVKTCKNLEVEQKQSSKKILTNLLKDNTINDIIDYEIIKKVTNDVSNVKLTSKNANEVFSCVHVIDEALREIEELLEYIKRLIKTACEKVSFENDWKELNERIDNMIIEIDNITKKMVVDVNYFLKLC